MKRSIVAAMAGTSLALCSAGIQADTVKVLDTSKLKATNVYVSVPQDKIFVESFSRSGPSVSQLHGWENLLVLNVFMFDLMGAAHRAESIDYDREQRRGLAVHDLLDSYDGGSVLRDGAEKAIKLLAWLHPKDVQVTNDGIGQFLRRSPSSDVDSVAAIQLYYSVTPDFQAAVVAGTLKLYSRALSPPVDPYDPSSKSEWLRKPVAIREYIYQSKLLQLPDKTQTVIDQLLTEADKAYDAVELKRQFDALPVDSGDVMDRRTMELTEKEKAYQTLIKDIKDPAWHDDDAGLMYALMWSAHDDSLLKQAVQDGADSLSDLITRSISAIPSDAASVAKDSDGKDSLFMVSKTPERTIYVDSTGFVFSASQDETSRVAMAIPPWAE